jgi:hypothetical protein
MDDLTTLRAEGGFKCGRVLQFLEVVLVGAVPDVHLGLEGVTAFLAVFPVASMAFVVMGPTKGVAVVISVATVPRVGKRNIFFMIVAYPVPTAISISNLTGFST